MARDRNKIRLTDESFAVAIGPAAAVMASKRMSTGPNKNRREVSRSRLQFAAFAG
jgi:hypothetical protein